MTQQERFIFRAKRFFNDTKRVKSLAMSSAGLVVVWNSGYIYDSVKTAIFGPEEEEDEVVEGASAVTGGSAETNQDDNITESSSVQSTSSSSIASETQTPTQTLAAPSDDSTNTHVEQQPSSPTPSSSLAIEPLSTPIDTVLPSLPEPLEGMLEGNIKLGSVEVSKKSVAATAAATGTLALIAALLTKSN